MDGVTISIKTNKQTKNKKLIFWIQCPLDWAKRLGMEVFLVETS